MFCAWRGHFWLEGRDSVVLRARDVGGGECLQGDGQDSFCACVDPSHSDLVENYQKVGPAVVSTEHMLASLLRRLLLTIMAIVSKLHIYVLARLMGYRSFLPQRDSILVTCCTNGLATCIRWSVCFQCCKQAGLEFPVIALAKAEGTAV